MQYGNLAYKEIPEYTPVRKKKKNVASKNVVRNTTYREKAINSNVRGRDAVIRRRLTVIRLTYLMIVAASATFMISKFVSVNDTYNMINKLNKELLNTQAYTSQNIFEMEQSVDLAEVEEIASKKLGMQRPEKYQMIYVDVKTDDVTEVTAGDVEGLKNKTVTTMSKLWSNIVNLFSIK